ncbi:hypothetical protein EW146_g6428 [Bondarzewia mesenterica]|uniref:EamA domain-containing protein n=1 Tax=Bondarzewia mesenterica TaxID=1095465 RepID=A0A4S4LNR2_9AGAM|nr:hypothetical protein EW146_g6428 [Bondarzewia mesenterica]
MADSANVPFVAISVFCSRLLLTHLPGLVGEMLCFLPVLYTWIASRRPSPVRLPTDNEPQDSAISTPLTDEDRELEQAGALSKYPPQHLSGWRVLLLWLPAFCDLTGTTLMNIGLLYTPVSIYQMTRGALVLFVGVLSVLFLHRRLWLYQWLSLITVMAGVSLVGFSGSLVKDITREDVTGLLNATDPSGGPVAEPTDQPEATRVLIGVFFILFAQIFTATQFVVEEKILSRYTVPPLLAVGRAVAGPAPRLASASGHADRALLWDRDRDQHLVVQLLWAERDKTCQCDGAELDGYLSYARHLDREFGIGMGGARVARLTSASRGFRVASVRNGVFFFHPPPHLLLILFISRVCVSTRMPLTQFLFNNLVNAPRFLRPSTQTAPLLVSDETLAEPFLSSETNEEREEVLDETAELPADLGQSGFDVVPSTDQHGRRRSTSRKRS